MPAASSRGRGRRTVNEINMVPFIDVMLVLLIIFMVTAPMLTPGAINVPSAGKSTKPAVKNVAHVLMNADGSIRIKTPNGEQAVSLQELGSGRCNLAIEPAGRQCGHDPGRQRPDL